MKKGLRRYAAAILMGMVFLALIIIFPDYREKAGKSLLGQLGTVALVLPPIFILLGLLDVWVPREKMIRILGEGSSVKGALVAFLLGSFAAGPLYGAFPFAAVLLKKGASVFNVMIFLGAWSTTKLPMLLFEISALGLSFALSRLAIDIVAIVFIALLVKRSFREDDLRRLQTQIP